MNRISAKIVADSTSQDKTQRLTTLEVVFPRYILAEVNTHRLFSRNSASSRAIPYKKMIKSVKNELFTPVAWQKDHSGMQGTEYFEGFRASLNNLVWKGASRLAILASKALNKLGVTKQLANRLLEPFLYHKVLVTSSEWTNFFELRCPRYEAVHYNKTFKSRKEFIEFYRTQNIGHDFESWSDLEWLKINRGMGEIHIMDLAEKIYDALKTSTPHILEPGDWHIPYGEDINLPPTIPIEEGLSLTEGVLLRKLKISVARCARLSYQTLGDNPKIDYTADLRLFDTLFSSGHLSPFEHVARLMTDDEYDAFTKGKLNIVNGITGQEVMINDGISEGWCNNFRGFIQYRWLLENKEKI